MKYDVQPHNYRASGHYLVFANGHKWSCVNLGSPLSNKDVSEESQKAFEEIGRLYDGMGGRFEAMMIDPASSDAGGSDVMFRAHSFEELFKKVADYESDPASYVEY